MESINQKTVVLKTDSVVDYTIALCLYPSMAGSGKLKAMAAGSSANMRNQDRP